MKKVFENCYLLPVYSPLRLCPSFLKTFDSSLPISKVQRVNSRAGKIYRYDFLQEIYHHLDRLE